MRAAQSVTHRGGWVCCRRAADAPTASASAISQLSKLVYRIEYATPPNNRPAANAPASPELQSTHDNAYSTPYLRRRWREEGRSENCAAKKMRADESRAAHAMRGARGERAQ